MAIEEVIIDVRAVADLKKLARTEEDLRMLQNAGLNVGAAMTNVRDRMRRLGDVAGKSTLIFRRFRGELLSVLFFGMGLSNAFQGMLTPAARLLKIFEIWSTTLSILFLPIMLAILPLVLKLSDFLMNLPESTQLAIGAFAILGFILGKLLFLIGFFGLAWQGIVQLFPSIAGGFTGIGGSLGILSGILLAVAAVVVGFWLAWKENFGNIKKWTEVTFEGMRMIGQSFIDGLKGWITLIKGLLTGNAEEVQIGIGQIFQSAVTMIDGFSKALSGAVVTIALSITKLVWNVLKSAFTAIWDFLTDINEKVVRFIASIQARIAGAVSGVFGGNNLTVEGNAGGNGGTTTNNSINFNPNVTVNATSNVDIDRLTDQLSNQLRDQVENLSRR